MTPLIILTSTFALAWLVLRQKRDAKLPGRIALATMLLATGAAHFVATDALTAMVPPQLPAPRAWVHATGLAELAFAGLLVVRSSAALGWTLALFFVALLPANVYSAVTHVGYGGHGPMYLWFRVPLQIVFIAWALLATGAVRPSRGAAATLRRAATRIH